MLVSAAHRCSAPCSTHQHSMGKLCGVPYKDPSSEAAVEAMRASRRKHYHSNPEAYKQRAHDRRQRIRQIVRDAKSVPCMDCGGTYPWFVMDFDHRPGEVKIATIAYLAQRTAAETKILAEMLKCDIVCSNCHRMRTYRRLIEAGVDDAEISL